MMKIVKTQIKVSIMVAIFAISMLIILNNDKSHMLKTEIFKHYASVVETYKETKIYKYNNNEFVVAGLIMAGEKLNLIDTTSKPNSNYFELADFPSYYIYYEDVQESDKDSFDNRYKKYIPFNENIITYDVTNFYDSNGFLVYSFNSSYDLPVIIKETDRNATLNILKAIFINLSKSSFLHAASIIIVQVIPLFLAKIVIIKAIINTTINNILIFLSFLQSE